MELNGRVVHSLASDAVVRQVDPLQAGEDFHDAGGRELACQVCPGKGSQLQQIARPEQQTLSPLRSLACMPNHLMTCTMTSRCDSSAVSQKDIKSAAPEWHAMKDALPCTTCEEHDA